MMVKYKINSVPAIKWDGTIEGIEAFRKTFPELTFRIWSPFTSDEMSTLEDSGYPFNKCDVFKNGEYLTTFSLTVDGWRVYDPVDGLRFYTDEDFNTVFEVDNENKNGELGFC